MKQSAVTRWRKGKLMICGVYFPHLASFVQVDRDIVRCLGNLAEAWGIKTEGEKQ